jgi:nucleoid-associated protein YgaU
MAMTIRTAQILRADAVMAVSILLLGSFLCFTGMRMVGRWHMSAARRQAPGVDDLLGAAAVGVGLAIVAWWIFAVLMALAVAVLARCGRGRVADRAGRFCPAFMRRLALAALSAQLLAAPLAHAALPPVGPAWTPTQEASVQAQWASTAKAQPGPQVPDVPAQTLELPGAERPSAETPETAPPSAVRPGWRPGPPVTDPGLLAARPVRTAQGPPPARLEVTVLAGDTLWDIASRHLGPTVSDVDVALHWPRWYEANKAQIGESPHVLLPGQILKAPSRA